MAFKGQWAVVEPIDVEQLHVSFFFIIKCLTFKKMKNRVNSMCPKTVRKPFPIQLKPAMEYPEITTILIATF